MQDFYSKHLELLALERESELEESLAQRSGDSAWVLEKEGICLTKLVVSELKQGLFGRVLVGLKKQHTLLPSHKLTTGDVLGVFTDNIGQPEVTGILYKVKPNKLVLAVDEFTINTEKCGVVLLANEITYKKQKLAIEKLMALPEDSYSFRVSRALMGENEPFITDTEEEFKFFNKDLNEFQKESVAFALGKCRDVGVIHGPPGTGKTTTVVEVILQAVAKGMKVLATAPSNVAVDNIVEKLSKFTGRICRVGHPARLLSHITKFSFDNRLKQTEQFELNNDVMKEIAGLNERLRNSGKNLAFAIRKELKLLRTELKQRRGKAVEELFLNCDVLLSTNISSGNKFIAKYAEKLGGFDLLVLDEAAQALEASCWVPILLSKRVILAGDHQQLSPTVHSQKAQAGGLGVTLLDRVVSQSPQVTSMLLVQYRMNSLIMGWSNTEFYGGRLLAAEGVATHTVAGHSPLLLIDTSGSGLFESGTVSKYNLAEADLVLGLVNELRTEDVAVITPYNAQVELLKSMNFQKKPEISSVDGFQGREKDVVVLSLVRSNAKKQVGFLSDYRRLNVAVTRARKLVCLIADCDTVGGPGAPSFLVSLVSYFRECAECRSIEEFQLGVAEFTEEKRVTEPPQRKKVEKGKKQEKLVSVQRCPETAVLQETQQEIRRFLLSSRNCFYTKNLFPAQRAQIHELAHSLGLLHETVGSGKKKKMLLSKSPSDIAKPLAFTELSEEELSDQNSPLEDSDLVTKLSNARPLPPRESSDEEFLAEMAAANQSCTSPHCSKLTVYIGVNCRRCLGRFCIEHRAPEAHGCTLLRTLSPPAKSSSSQLALLKQKAQNKRKALRTKPQKKK